MYNLTTVSNATKNKKEAHAKIKVETQKKLKLMRW